MDFNHSKQEPGLVQSLKSEPALLVKEDIMEDSSQGTTIPANIGRVNEDCGTSLSELLNVKHELDEMDIGPTVLQPMDIHYTLNKNMSAGTGENTIVGDGNKAMPCSGVKKESPEDKLRGYLTPQKTTMNERTACSALQSLQLRVLKDQLESICKVQLMKLVTFQCELCGLVYAEKHWLLQHLQSVHGSHPQTSLFVKFCKTDKQRCAATSRQKMIEDDYDEAHVKSCLRQQMNLQQYRLRQQRTTRSNSFKCDSTSHKPHLLSAHNKVNQRNNRKNSMMASSVVAPPSNQNRDETGKKKQKPNVCKTKCSSKVAKFAQSNAKQMRVCMDEKHYKCDTCDSRFKNRNGLTVHMRIHTGEKPYRCDICNTRFRQSSALTVHMKVHTGEKPYRCDICYARFRQRIALTGHMGIHTGEKPYWCDICYARYRSYSGLSYHLKVHKSGKPHPCDTCGKRFATNSVLIRHMRNIHMDEKPYWCDMCVKTFKVRYALIDHIRGHMGAKPYRCDTCNAGFKGPSTLSDHMRCHTGEKPYWCDTCNAAFKVRGALIDHLRCHTGEKPYRCDTCDARFARRRTIIQHMKVHSSEKPYSCDTCDARYKDRRALIEHRRVNHTGEKPYRCDTCDARFARRRSLIQHIKIHTG